MKNESALYIAKLSGIEKIEFYLENLKSSPAFSFTVPEKDGHSHFKRICISENRIKFIPKEILKVLTYSFHLEFLELRPCYILSFFCPP